MYSYGGSEGGFTKSDFLENFFRASPGIANRTGRGISAETEKKRARAGLAAGRAASVHQM